MPLTDIKQIALRHRPAPPRQGKGWRVDADIGHRGVQRPSIPDRDREFFEAVSEQAQDLRDLVEMIRERQRG